MYLHVRPQLHFHERIRRQFCAMQMWNRCVHSEFRFALLPIREFLLLWAFLLNHERIRRQFCAVQVWKCRMHRHHGFDLLLRLGWWILPQERRGCFWVPEGFLRKVLGRERKSIYFGQGGVRGGGEEFGVERHRGENKE